MAQCDNYMSFYHSLIKRGLLGIYKQETPSIFRSLLNSRLFSLRQQIIKSN